MRTFKWLFSIIIVLVLILGVGMPFLIGVWIQKSYSKIFIVPHNAGGLQMSLLQYNRGFYSSTAKVAISFSKAGAGNHIVFNQVIQHGPIIFGKHPILALAVATSISEDPKFNASARTVWHLNKRIVSTIKIPSLDLANLPVHFSLQNLNMKINFHAIHKTLKAMANIDTMEFQGSTPFVYTVTLNKLSSTQDLYESNHIWYGSRSGNVAQVNIKNSIGPLAQLNNLFATGNVTESGDKTNIEFNYKAQNSTILNNPINALDFAFSITGLDSKALSNVIEKSDAKKEDPNATNTRALSDSALDLISKGVVVKLDHFTLSTAQGEAKADGQVSLPALGAGNIFQLIASLKIDFNLQIPQTSLISALTTYYQNEKSVPAITGPALFAQQQVNQWIQSEVLVPASNGLLVMKVQFENAKLLVNGVEQHSAPSAGASTGTAPATGAMPTAVTTGTNPAGTAPSTGVTPASVIKPSTPSAS